LRQLIGFYGDNMQWMVPKYLEQSMQALSSNQDKIRGYFQNTFGSMFPFGSTLEEMSKQNMAMFERTLRMFTPFGGATEPARLRAHRGRGGGDPLPVDPANGVGRPNRLEGPAT
jgi:polyhydroxyalkanoate synthesis regulator protein